MTAAKETARIVWAQSKNDAAIILIEPNEVAPFRSGKILAISGMELKFVFLKRIYHRGTDV